jgi:hypothetical protein
MVVPNDLVAFLVDVDESDESLLFVVERKRPRIRPAGGMPVETDGMDSLDEIPEHEPDPGNAVERPQHLPGVREPLLQRIGNGLGVFNEMIAPSFAGLPLRIDRAPFSGATLGRKNCHYDINTLVTRKRSS